MYTNATIVTTHNAHIRQNTTTTYGLRLAVRYAHPPNSLHLCGPDNTDLLHYATTQSPDHKTHELLRKFSTFYPYLLLIAQENNIRDPFDARVVDAYWTGNTLLSSIAPKQYIEELNEHVGLKRKSPYKNNESVFEKIAHGAPAHHNFHVMNVYKRTGHMDILHTTQTMNACIINWGKVIHKSPTNLTVNMRTLCHDGKNLFFDTQTHRTIRPPHTNDPVFQKVKNGDVVSYHWGTLSERLSRQKLLHLQHFTRLALAYANQNNT